MPNSRLTNAINDLHAVFGGTNKELKAFQPVDDAISKLDSITQQFYQNNSVLTDENINEIMQGYAELLNSCDRVLANEKNLGATGFGRGRIECIKVLRNIAVEDMRSIQDSLAVEGRDRTLLNIVQQGRSLSANINHPENIKTVGGMLSSRVPIRLHGADGSTEECFFTPETTLKTYDDSLQEILNETANEYGKNSKEYKLVEKFQNLSDDDYYSMLNMDIVHDLPKLKDPENRDSYMRKATFKNIFRPFLEIMGESVPGDMVGLNARKDENAQKFREFIADKIVKIAGIQGTIYVNNEQNGIPFGSNIDKRNSGMSSVADYLGMGKLIAGSRNFEITINDEKKKGTLQQKAQGYDINNLPKGHEFFEVGEQVMENYKPTLESPDLKRDLADLMALDYLCGNADRHGGNMVYKTERDKNGKLIITGITGIDNDLSFGTVTAVEADNENEPSKMVNPADMRVMRAETASKILNLSNEKLDFILKDMNLSKEELDACHKRLKTLQDQISNDLSYQKKHGKELREGHLVILDDKEFAEPQYSLNNMSSGKAKMNYFDRLRDLPEFLHDKKRNKRYDSPERVTYNDATAEKAQLKYSDMDPKLNVDIEETRRQVEEAKRIIDNLGIKIFGSNSGHFKWMKESVEQLNQKFKGISNGKENGSVQLSTAEAVQLETMFRQLKNAGQNYMDTHKKNPFTPSGKERRRAAEALSKLEIKYAPEEKAIVNEDNGIKRQNSVHVTKRNVNELDLKLHGEKNKEKNDLKNTSVKSKVTTKTGRKEKEKTEITFTT